MSETKDIFELPDFEFLSKISEFSALRLSFFKNKLQTCAIAPVKSGRCTSKCAFCAQSAISNAKINVYPMMKAEEMAGKALTFFRLGVNRFSFVSSGISPTKEELREIARAIEIVKGEFPNAKICASLGILNKRQLKYLKSSGLDRYHHNLETSERFYPKISPLDWRKKVETVKNAKAVGLSVCSGGIFGIGETLQDIESLFKVLKSLEVDSVPVNFLHPIKGTPLQNAKFLTPVLSLKILAVARVILKDTSVRVCGGREYNLRELQPLSLLLADALMVGNYLTTRGRSLKDDAQMIKDMGLISTLKV